MKINVLIQKTLFIMAFMVGPMLAGSNAASDVTKGKTADWAVLLKAIGAGDLATVKSIVPSKIEVNERNNTDKHALAIATDVKKRYAAIEDYLEEQFKAQPTKGTWDVDHAKSSAALQRAVTDLFDDKVDAAQQELTRALALAKKIKHEGGNIQAIGDQGQTLYAQAQNIGDVVGSMPPALAPTMKELTETLQRTKPTVATWDELTKSLDLGDLQHVRKIVPSVIKANKKNKDGLTPVDIAHANKSKRADVLSYLQSEALAWVEKMQKKGKDDKDL